MGLIAIAANPASGRDIRRLVSSATVFNNREKQNIVERIILAASQFGKHRFCIMPDSYHFAEKINAHLMEDFHSIPEGMVYMPDLPFSNGQKDTTRFAEYAREKEADVFIVLGGDGTSRVAAKGVGQVPMISISTGTNNVFPEVAEGTVVGLAAAVLASGTVKSEDCCSPCKRIEIYLNGEFCDIALVDVVFSDYAYSGSKAIWSREDINRVVVTQCHPASIGFSAIAGCRLIVSAEDDCGAVAECGNGKPNTRVSLAAGVVTPVEILSVKKAAFDQALVYRMEGSGTLALDGEREICFRAGDEVTLQIRRNGPRRVDIKKTLSAARQKGFFVV